jgi:HTH-type transcriptional regulator / antitoxin HigA
MKLHIDNNILMRQIESDARKDDVDITVAGDANTFIFERILSDIEKSASDLPLKEIVKRGWFNASSEELKHSPSQVAREFFLAYTPSIAWPAFCRRTLRNDYPHASVSYSVLMWLTYVTAEAEERNLRKVRFDDLTPHWFREVAQLSSVEHGPLIARDYLSDYGIALVTEPHLPGTKLDGIATMAPSGTAVVGMTLRYDRIDNFWFTLLHELSHIALHLKKTDQTFLDDLDTESTGRLEREADRFASEALIPRRYWPRSAAFLERTESAIKRSAQELGVHPAIIAGRLQRDERNYRAYRSIVDAAKVRHLFM